MKLVLIALAMFAGSQAFAHQRGEDCTPYFVADNSETAAGVWISPCGPVTQHRGCNEGEIGYFPVDNGSSYGGEGSAPEVARVCHNGSFFPVAQPVKHRGCSEGEISYSNELDPSGNFYQNVTLVCQNGRFVRR